MSEYKDTWYEKLTGMVRETAAYEAPGSRGQYTIEDYFRLPDGDRKELIDGVFYDMASPDSIHQFLVAEIYRSISNYIEENDGECMPFVAPLDAQLDCDDKTMVQPDVFVVCNREKLQQGRVVGAPDFVVEVMSASTGKRDRTLKFMKYMDAGVKEYWMVAPDRKAVFVYHMEEAAPVEIYRFCDQVPMGIFGGECKVDFGKITRRIQFL